MNQIKLKIGKYYRLQMASFMLVADLGGFFVTGIIIYLMNINLNFFQFGFADMKYLIVVLLCISLFMTSRLYPGVGINPADEIRLVTQFISTGFMLGLVFFMIMESGWRVNYFALLPTWGVSLLTILLMRWTLRIIAARLGLWGEPVVMIGKSPQINQLSAYFVERKRLGFIPMLVASSFPHQQTISSTVPMIDLDSLKDYPDEYFAKSDIQTALVDLSTISNAFNSGVSHSLFRLFRQVIFISDADWLEGASMQVRDFEGLLGMEASKTIITPAERAIKRGLDVSISLFVGIFSLPIVLIVALLIKLDSPGPVFYSQNRIGRYGKNIKVYKFRSMRIDAEQTLADCLAHDTQARLEWEKTKKLKNDPRCTTIGRWIRKFSIDEIPQLFNILKGDMSLVGPRPLPEYHYNQLSEKTRSMRSAVRPGLTGMWQVSGRSKTGTSELEMWDCYYIHNWSAWLDVYILLRTVWVVFSADGAY